MAVEKTGKKDIKDTAGSVKEEESEKTLISEEEEADLSSEDKDTEETEDIGEEPETSEETEDTEEADEAPEKKESRSKAKKDPVPAIMIVLIYAVIICAVLFYVLPIFLAPSFGMTLDEYKARLSTSQAEQMMNSKYSTVIPSFKLVDKNSIKEIWGIKGEVAPEDQAKIDARFKPFIKTYAASEEFENVLVEARTRANDGQLTRISVYCTYDDAHMSMLMVHFGALLTNFFPDMNLRDGVMLVMGSSMESNTEGLYTVKDDIAYRLSAENIGGKKTYIKLDIVPAKSLKPEQIKAAQASEPASSKTAASSETSAAETTAAS